MEANRHVKIARKQRKIHSREMDRSTDTRRNLRQEMDLNKKIPQTSDKPFVLFVPTEGQKGQKQRKADTQSVQVRESRLYLDLVNPRGSLEPCYSSVLQAHPVTPSLSPSTHCAY